MCPETNRQCGPSTGGGERLAASIRPVPRQCLSFSAAGALTPSLSRSAAIFPGLLPGCRPIDGVFCVSRAATLRLPVEGPLADTRFLNPGVPLMAPATLMEDSEYDIVLTDDLGTPRLRNTNLQLVLEDSRTAVYRWRTASSLGVHTFYVESPMAIRIELRGCILKRPGTGRTTKSCGAILENTARALTLLTLAASQVDAGTSRSIGNEPPPHRWPLFRTSVEQTA